ncbi:MAG: tetratricopeptide repeat protein [Tannerella sp.]|jgi:tetratricopeptide (TPR) repeat protein|nr:tetratricopeptide repeat protein [Tannerella sp.]
MRKFVLSGMLWMLLLAVGEGARAQTYEEMIEKSYDFVDRNDLPAAEECLKAAMRLEPANRNNYALLTNLGTIQRRQGKSDDALVSYTAALNQQPKNEVILSNRAELYTEMNETEKALSDYQVLLSINPKNEDALFHRGLLYLGMQNLIPAEADFEKILDLNGETIQGRLGYALLEKVRKNYDNSETILNYLIGKRPEYWRLYEERAELYYLMNKNARAMADLNKVFAEEPDPSAELYVLRGRVKLAQYEKASAAIDFKKALSMGYDAETVETLLKQTY